MGIGLLPAQLIDQQTVTTPGNTNTTNTEIISLQVTVLTTITKEQPTARRHYLERLVMGQLAKTRVTHPNYPNFHGIRQYRVLIIPFSAKLNVIPYRYITQHDTRSPSQHPHSWMEEQLQRNLQISSSVAISLSHLGKLKAFLKLRQFMVSLLIDDYRLLDDYR